MTACLKLVDTFRCRVMSPHYKEVDPSAPADTRGLLQVCVSDPALSAALGPPPTGDLRNIDAFTCEACPVGQGMGPSGRCELCDVDVEYDWSYLSTSCRVQTFEQMESGANDYCPDTYVVQVMNAGGPSGVTGVGQSIPSDFVDPEECAASSVSGSVSAGGVTRAVGAQGVARCLPPATLCPDERCYWGGSGREVGTAVNAASIRVETRATPGLAEVSFYSFCPPDVVK